MDFEVRYDPQLEDFRREVAAWLGLHAPRKAPASLSRTFSPQEVQVWVSFHRELAEKGWVAPSWPLEYGGGGLTPVHDLVVKEELSSRDIPPLYEANVHVAEAILLWGSDEQRHRFLMPLLKGDAVAFKPYGYSDAVAYPDEVTTHGVKDGDFYILSGEGIYLGGPGKPTHLWVIAVTNPDKQPHQRLGAFLIPTDLPDIMTLDLEAVALTHRSSVSLNEVKVPVEYRVGEDGDGWIVARSALGGDAETDRSLNRQRALVDALVQLCKESPSEKRDQQIRELVAEAYINAKVLSLLHLRNTWLLTTGQDSAYSGPQYTLMAKDMERRLADTALEIMGPSALTDDPEWTPDSVETGLLQRAGIPGRLGDPDVYPGDDTILTQRLLWSYLGSIGTKDDDSAATTGEGEGVESPNK